MITLAAILVAGCAGTLETTTDLARKSDGPEHPLLSQAAVNLPTPEEMDIFVVPIPGDWQSDLVGGTFQNEETVKAVHLKQRYAFRAELCDEDWLGCKTSAIVEGNNLYVLIPHGFDSVRVISASGEKYLYASRLINRQLTPEEKREWWGEIEKLSGGGKIILADTETQEIITVTPLGQAAEAATISGMTEDWQKAAACGLMSVSTSDVASLATQSMLFAARKGLQGFCYARKQPNVLTVKGT
jgi:hypothetical protein